MDVSLVLASLLVVAVTASNSNCTLLTKHDALLIIDVQNGFMESVNTNSTNDPEYEIPESQIDDEDMVLKGSLAVDGTAEIIPLINDWISAFNNAGSKVFASLDWHPKDHCSFCRNGTNTSNPGGFHPNGAVCPLLGPEGFPENFNMTNRCGDILSLQDYNRGQLTQWPDHCLQADFSSWFSPFLKIPQNATVVKKGFVPGLDSYSAFNGVQSVGGYPFWNSTEDETQLVHQPLLGLLLAQSDIRRLFVVGIASDYCVRMSSLDAVDQRFGDVIMVQSACRGVTPNGVDAALATMSEAGVIITPNSLLSPSSVLDNACQQITAGDDGEPDDSKTVMALTVLSVLFGVTTVVLGVLLVCFRKKNTSGNNEPFMRSNIA